MEEDQFWSHALGEWIKDCVSGPSAIVPEDTWRTVEGQPLKYSELCDGYVLNLLFYFIQPSTADHMLIHSRDTGSVAFDAASRFKNFHLLLRNMHRFYKEHLNKVIAMTASPELICIVKHPVPEVSAHELNKVLLLLLGCAVQSDQKEHFIERIHCMRTSLQASLVDQIQKVTSDNNNTTGGAFSHHHHHQRRRRHSSNSASSSSSLSASSSIGSHHELHVQALDLLPDDNRILGFLEYLERIMKERDDHAMAFLEMAARVELDEAEHGSTGTATSSSSCSGDYVNPINADRRMPTELASLRAELRNVRSEKESLDNEVTHLDNELREREREIAELRQKQQELVKENNKIQQYKDRIEGYKADLQKSQKIEVQYEALKKKLVDLEHYKNLVASRDSDIEVLQNYKNLQDIELDELTKKMGEMESTKLKLRESMANESKAKEALEKEQQKYTKLFSENANLEEQLVEMKSKCANLERRLETQNFMDVSELSNNSLHSQMEMSNNSTVLELQLEIKQLKKQLHDRSSFAEPAEVEQLRQKLETTQLHAEQKTGEIENLQSQLRTMEEKKAAAEAQIAEVEADRSKLASTLNETRLELVKTQKEERASSQTMLKIREAENKADSLEERVRTLADECSQSKMVLERSKQSEKATNVELENAREKLIDLEAALSAAERARKSLETERNSLKTKMETLEDECDQLNARVVNLSTLERRLANIESALVEKTNFIADLEADQRAARQHLDLETKKAQRLREDLVTEKVRLGDLLARLRSVCSAITANGGKVAADNEALQCDDKLIEIIDDVIMKALNAARREADALRLQQQLQIAELDDLKRDVENLRRAEMELVGSDDKVSELVVENKNVKEQVAILQERLRKAQIEETTRSTELQAARREIEELQAKSMTSSRNSAEVAKLQVQLRNAQLQEDFLRDENTELRRQIEEALREKLDITKRLSAIEATQAALVTDYDRLQNLHQLLGQDYDRAKFELAQAKQRLKHEKAMNERNEASAVKSGKADDVHRVALREAEHEIARLQNELDNFRRENSAMLRSTDERSDELRRLRVAECSQKSTIASLNGTIQEMNHILAGKDHELAILRRNLDTFKQFNGDENQSLIKQIELLLLKNQELHERSLNDKDTFHAVQRDLLEQMATLRRNKEKLEEKIMDQYKSMDNKKVPKEKQTFVKRAAKALMPKHSTRKTLKALPAPLSGTGSTTEDSSVDENHPASSPPPPIALSSSNDSSSHGLVVRQTQTTIQHHRQTHKILEQLRCSSPGPSVPSTPHSTCEPFPLAKSNSVGTDNANLNRVRMRNGFVGGSMRIVNRSMTPTGGITNGGFAAQAANRMLRSSIRITPRSRIEAIGEDAFSLCGSERAVDASSPKPFGIHHSKSMSAAFTPPKPNLNVDSRIGIHLRPPPPYKMPSPAPLPHEFRPQDSSTPTPKDSGPPTSSSPSSTLSSRRVSSQYENVDLPQQSSSNSDPITHSRGGSAVWLEYGCV